MVLKSLFTGQQWRTDIENRLTDMGRGEERVRCMERVTWKHITVCTIDSQQEFACVAQETQTGALYQPRGVGWGGRWEGGSGGRGCMYTYG